MFCSAIKANILRVWKETGGEGGVEQEGPGCGVATHTYTGIMAFLSRCLVGVSSVIASGLASLPATP